MLAYVFWHTPEEGVDTGRYEASLGTFHRALEAAAIRGFHGSTVFRLGDGVPWMAARPVYEDWYMLADSAALDPLNEAAVGARMRPSHDDVAQLAGAGTAGLYRRRRVDSWPQPEHSVAVWLGKPRDVPYGDFRSALQSTAPPESEVWQRQMVLGPTSEFCVVGTEPELADGRFPDAWRPRAVRRRRIIQHDRTTVARPGE